MDERTDWEGGAQTLLFLVELEQIRLEKNYDHDYIAFLALFFLKVFLDYKLTILITSEYDLQSTF